MVGISGPLLSWERGLLSILPSPFFWRMTMGESTVLREVKGKVLIVDDAPDSLEIIQRLLHYEGYDVTIASSGEEGGKKVEKEKPEEVLMDINIPGIRGTE